MLEYEDYKVNKSFFDRLKRSLRDDFKINLEYVKERGYRLEQPHTIENVIRFLELANTVQLLTKNTHHIYFESPTPLGLQHMFVLKTAIDEGRAVTFVHSKFQENTEKQHTIYPYLLKEYLNRWYVVGHSIQHNAIRAFGLDRISHLVANHSLPKHIADPNVTRNFLDVIGLNYSHEKVEKVVLQVSDIQAKYMLTYPWHHSQEHQVDEHGNHIFTFYLKPNKELVQRISMYGSDVRVMEPTSLRQTVLEDLQKVLHTYNG